MNQALTLHKYAEVKRMTDEEVTILAATKGLNIPIMPEFELSEDILSVLDPVLLHQRNFSLANVGKVFSATANKVFSNKAFMDFEGISGCLTLHNAIWRGTNDLREVITEGETYDVELLGYNDDKQQIELGRKNLIHDKLIDYSDTNSSKPMILESCRIVFYRLVQELLAADTLLLLIIGGYL